MIKIEELYSDQKFDLIVFYLKEYGIILADSLQCFDFNKLNFVPGVAPELVEEAKQLYFSFAIPAAEELAAGEQNTAQPMVEFEFKPQKFDECCESIEDEIELDKEPEKQSLPDAQITDVYEFVPRSASFIRYCLDKNKKMMSQLTKEDFILALSLRGLGVTSVKRLEDIYLDFYNNPKNYVSMRDEESSEGTTSIEDVFGHLPHGGALIRYCREEGIETIQQLKYFDFDHRVVKGIGEQSMKKLHQVYLSTIETISDAFVEADSFSNISDENRRMTIQALKYCGVSLEVIRKLNSQGYYFVEDICKKGLSAYDYHQIKKVIVELECPISKMFSTKFNALKDIEKVCLTRRCHGDTLQKIADDVGLTRERVRQITAKRVRNLMSTANMAADCLLWPDRTNFTFSDMQLFFNNDLDAELCRFVLQESDEVVYLNFADKFIRRSACPDNLDMALQMYTADIIGDGLNFYDNLERIESQLAEYGLEILNFEDIMNYLVKTGFHFYGDYVTKGKQSYAKVCHDAVKKYFPNGIKLDDNEENEDMKRLRKIISQHYHGLNIPDNNRALTARVAPLLILSGRGQYCDITSVIYNIKLFKEVYQFIQESEQTSLYFSEIFSSFKGRFLAETNITNSNFLHGMLKYLYPDDFIYERDLLVKWGEPKQVIEDRICDLILNKKRPVTKVEIKENIPGLNDHVIAFATTREPKLIQWEFNVFNHVDNIMMNSDDYLILEDILRTESNKYNGYLSESLLFSAVKPRMPEFLTKNEIRNAQNLYYTAAAYFGTQYKFSRPHIVSPDFPVDEPSILNIAKVLLDYATGINYMEFVSLANKLGWANGTLYAVFSELEKGCIRISENDYVDENNFVLSEGVLQEFKKQLNLFICDSGYFALNAIFDFNKFPDCNYEWNGFLVESIISRFETGFKIIAPQVKDRRYQRGIIVYSSYRPDSFEELVADQLKKDGIRELSEQEMEKYLKMKGLIVKVIPQELYECADLRFKNEIFTVLN